MYATAVAHAVALIVWWYPRILLVRVVVRGSNITWVGLLSVFAKLFKNGINSSERLASWLGAIRCEWTREDRAEVSSRSKYKARTVVGGEGEKST